MNKFRSGFFYVITITVLSAVMYLIFIKGHELERGKIDAVAAQYEEEAMQIPNGFSENAQHPLAILLLQIIIIIAVARLLGWICKKIRQPAVIGEILAGILLGPSFFALHFPGLSASVFPEASIGNLEFLSQFGLILFMFVIGMEVDLNVIRRQAKEAIMISHASIIFPFALGVALAYFIFVPLAPPSVPFLSFGLFMGIAMSITAFPVLARIIRERGIQKTKVGMLAITCAAADDITAWCILAAEIAIVKAGSLTESLPVMLLAITFILVMIKIVRPMLNKLISGSGSSNRLGKPVIAIFFIVLLASAYITEVIGIHALFGAFMAGTIMPDHTNFRNMLISKVEDVALLILLPLFFVLTGLRTEIGLINEPWLWLVTAIIILVAVIGKFAGSAATAKFTGQSWQDSLTIGALMNTRGLMELVVLNIGFDLGILSPQIFSMLVIMAIVTTIMTGPALDLIKWRFNSITKRTLTE